MSSRSGYMRGRSYTADVDAISVDASLGELRARLDITGDPRLQLVDVTCFVEEQLTRLRPRVHAVSFVLEVLDLYEQILADPFDPSGLDPQFLELASATLENLGERIEARKYRQFPGVVERLSTLAACQYSVTGSYEDVVRVLSLAEAEVAQEPGTSGDAQSWLIGILGIRYPQQVDWAHSIVRHLVAWDQPTTRRCHFPAVLHIPPSQNGTSHHGFLRQLTLDIRAFSNKRDHFSLEFAVDTDSDWYLKPVLTAGRTVLTALTPDAARHSFQGGYGASAAGMAHTGSSAGLAMASLFISQAQHFTDQRLRCVMSPGTVLSGEILDTGRIQDVAPNTLAAKIEAVFFSPAKILVLPLGQLEQATRHVRHLRDQYPRRRLTLLGKETLTDVFSDRRVVTIRERSRIAHTAVRFWRRKWAVSALLTAIVFMTAFAAWRLLSVDTNPVVLDISDAGVRLLNQHEQVIWRKEASNRTAAYYSTRTYPTTSRTKMLIDVNGDGVMDAFWVEASDSLEIERMSMHSLDGQTLSPLWDPFPLKVALDYPYDVSIYTEHMKVADMEAADLTGDGLPEFVVSLSHRSYYPAVITIMNPRTGSFSPGYHHAGQLSDVMVADLDGSHPPEILAVGTNNSYNSAVLAVLDVDNLAGSGPADGQYRGGRPSQAVERAYLKFPLTPLARYTGLPYAIALQMDILKDPEMVRVYTRDLRDLGLTNSGPTGLRWNLDYQLRPIAVGTDDHFDNTWESALEEGAVDMPLDNDLKINLMHSIEQWTQDGWVPVPLSERANVPNRVVREVN